MTRPWWVSVEGLNGVGKSHLARRLALGVGTQCRLVHELTDLAADHLPGQVIAALAGAGGTFLRTGHPLTETFALLALKVREYELIQAQAPHMRLIVEDRGVDTVAVYQAAILADAYPSASSADLVSRIHRAAAAFRPPPDLTLLLTDDFDTCLHRFAARLGQPVSAADRALLAQVARLYADLAAADPARVRVVDRTGRGEDDVLAEMRAHCRALVEQEAPCHDS
jgi:dTMP kinase